MTHDARVDSVWRLLGVVVLAIAALILTDPSSGGAGRVEMAALALAGLCLCVFGGQRTALGFAALVLGSVLARILSGALPFQLAEEYLPLFVLTGLGALLAPAAQLALLRVATCVVMVFAALHKANADFLDPSVSCATAHAAPILARLPAAETLAAGIPLLALVGEALVPVLLVLAPRVGVPYSVLLMIYIGHRGATPFTMLVMALACAFLARGDHASMRDAAVAKWRWLVATILVATAVTAPLHDGLADWGRYGLFVAMASGLLFALAVGLLPVVARERRVVPLWREGPLVPRGAFARTLLALVLVAGVVNGMTPYLGAKLRMSFAMFSNLRVDDARWNSLIVPHGVFRPAHDPYVHVVEGGGVLHEGLYAPRILASTLERVARGPNAVLLRYAREERRFRDVGENSELSVWLGSLPPGIVFHEFLALRGPQRCIH